MSNSKKYYTKLNVDRTILLNDQNINDDFKIINNYYACYHLENEIKTGLLGLNIINLNYNENISSNYTVEESKISTQTPYGILDIKEINDYIFSANSNGSISIFSKDCNLTSNYPISETNCTNIISKLSDNTIVIGFNEGEYSLFDINKLEVISNPIKIHKYGIWAIHTIDDNIFLTGADDNKVLLSDKRTNKIETKYEFHNGGITHLNQYFNDEKTIISGSYDENITLFDLRDSSKYMKKQKINVSIWDIKQIEKEGKYLFVSCIYDGLNGYHIIEDNLTFLENTFQFNEHNSIVYGIDYVRINDNKFLFSSCSLYDNLICYWELDI